MLEFLKRRLKSEKGAMDKILVTLLLVIVGVGAVVGLTSWVGGETDKVQAGATNQINNVLADQDGGTDYNADSAEAGASVNPTTNN